VTLEKRVESLSEHPAKVVSTALATGVSTISRFKGDHGGGRGAVRLRPVDPVREGYIQLGKLYTELADLFPDELLR
jgi:hypothetical protein